MVYISLPIANSRNNSNFSPALRINFLAEHLVPPLRPLKDRLQKPRSCWRSRPMLKAPCCQTLWRPTRWYPNTFHDPGVLSFCQVLRRLVDCEYQIGPAPRCSVWVTFGAKMNLLCKIRPNFFDTKLPILAKFSTNETMGYSTTFGLTRKKQPDFSRYSIFKHLWLLLWELYPQSCSIGAHTRCQRSLRRMVTCPMLPQKRPRSCRRLRPMLITPWCQTLWLWRVTRWYPNTFHDPGVLSFCQVLRRLELDDWEYSLAAPPSTRTSYFAITEFIIFLHSNTIFLFPLTIAKVCIRLGSCANNKHVILLGSTAITKNINTRPCRSRLDLPHHPHPQRCRQLQETQFPVYFEILWLLPCSDGPEHLRDARPLNALMKRTAQHKGLSQCRAHLRQFPNISCDKTQLQFRIQFIHF